MTSFERYLFHPAWKFGITDIHNFIHKLCQHELKIAYSCTNLTLQTCTLYSAVLFNNNKCSCTTVLHVVDYTSRAVSWTKTVLGVKFVWDLLRICGYHLIHSFTSATKKLWLNFQGQRLQR